MKQVIISIIFSLSFLSSQSQVIDFFSQKTNEQYRYYMSQRKTYNIAGAIMLTGGLIMSAVSLGGWAGDDFNGPWKNETMFFAGGGLALASIPMFIIAGKNKRKAKLALKGETVGWGKWRRGGNYLAVGFSIQL